MEIDIFSSMPEISPEEAMKREQQDFLTILQRYLPKPRHSRILNLFCGMALEEPVIYEHFGSDTELISIDNDPDMHTLAREHGMKSFVQGNIHELESLIEGKFDLVLMRNPPFLADDADVEFRKAYWLFNTLKNYLEPKGELYITLLNSCERDMIPRVIEAAGYSDVRLGKDFFMAYSVRCAHMGRMTAIEKDNFVVQASAPTLFSRMLSWGMKPYDSHAELCGYE